MKKIIVASFLSLNVFALECDLLRQDTASLQGIGQALNSSPECSKVGSLKFPLQRLKAHYEIIFDARPDWILIGEALLDFDTCNQGIDVCNIPQSQNAIAEILRKSSITLNEFCKI